MIGNMVELVGIVAHPLGDIAQVIETAFGHNAPGYDRVRGKRFHGSITLERKDDLKARGEASPDLWATVLR